MEDLSGSLFDRIASLVVTHPGAALGLVAAVGLMVLVWGVVSTSYRYR